MLKNAPSGQALERVERIYMVSVDSYGLGEILEAMGLPPTMRSFEVIAVDLSMLAGKRPPWTKKYVHSVYRGVINPSQVFLAAVSALAQVVDGVPPGVAGTSQVTVFADVTAIPEGVLIPRGAKVIKCARPGCPVWFIRIHPRQKYHDRSCRL